MNVVGQARVALLLPEPSVKKSHRLHVTSVLDMECSFQHVQKGRPLQSDLGQRTCGEAHGQAEASLSGL